MQRPEHERQLWGLGPLVSTTPQTLGEDKTDGLLHTSTPSLLRTLETSTGSRRKGLCLKLFSNSYNLSLWLTLYQKEFDSHMRINPF